MISIGSRLQNFEVIRSLGAGGMSEVYLVRDNLDRLFALKILSASLTKDNSFRERFKLEAKVMASLNHPNIIGLHSYFEEQGSYCLVMEYMEGGSLKDLIRRRGPIPEARALPIFRQIAEALAYAHSQGIIHRDVKPSNIMISADGQYKMGDFGIARMQETEGLTRTGSRMGTLIYMSPEQIKDSKHVDAKTDVYSLGVTLYEMLTGRAPYNESTESDYFIMDRIVRQDLPDPRTFYPYISETTLDLLKLATCRDPNQRPQFSELLNVALSAPAPEHKPEPEPMLHAEPEPEPEPEPLASIYPDPDEPPSPLPKSHKKRITAKVGWIIRLIVALTLILIAIGTNIERKKKNDKENELIFVKGGSFSMGSNDGEQDEQPVHQVMVSSFYIGKCEVTQAAFSQYMQPEYDWESEYGLGDNYPAYYVSWYAAIKYCNLRSLAEGLTPCYSISGSTNPEAWGAVPTPLNATWDAVTCNFSANGYRLPTEAEWEFAARGGVRDQGYKYSGSNDPGSVVWYDENSGNKTQVVGTKAANKLGIYDMSGNVWEWCWDWYSSIYYSISSKDDPTGPKTGKYRLLRGGSWFYNASVCAVSHRSYIDATYAESSIGFRLCRSAK